MECLWIEGILAMLIYRSVHYNNTVTGKTATRFLQVKRLICVAQGDYLKWYFIQFKFRVNRPTDSNIYTFKLTETA